jgi:hypothetical protein
MRVISSTPVSLTEVIEESNLIIEVECVEKYSEEVQIKNRESEDLISPFIKKGFVFKVNNILKNTTGIEIPNKIKVPNENWRRLLSQHQQQFANGANKSFNIKVYETEVSSIKDATVIFLYHFQGMFDLAAKDAFESASGREKIEMLLSH